MSGPLHRFKPQKLLPRSWRRGDRLRRQREATYYWRHAAETAKGERDFWACIAHNHARRLEKVSQSGPRWRWMVIGGAVVAGIVAVCFWLIGLLR